MQLTQLQGLVAVGVVGASLTLAGPASAYADDSPEYPCSKDSALSERVQTVAESLPRKYLDLDEADRLLRQRGTVPGEGVTVAVVDSGVAGEGGYSTLDVVRPMPPLVKGPIEYPHGTHVAGLVAGGPQRAPDGRLLPVGVAPGATIADLRVYQGTATESGNGGIPTSNVVAALDWLTGHAEAQGIKVVVLAMDLPGSEALKSAIGRLATKDLVIVAASGNRPTSEEGDRLGRYATLEPGEDVAEEVFPAGYQKQVLAVTATGDGDLTTGEPVDASGNVLLNSATDLAAPTFGAITLDPSGSTCQLREIATSWSTAEVAGVLAMLMSAYPDETAAQVEARLLRTADGRTTDRNKLYGAGMVQPVEALTRVLHPGPRGQLSAEAFRPRVHPRATAPERAADPLGNLLDRALWWAILGGAALVVTALLRPLLRRSRRSAG